MILGFDDGARNEANRRHHCIGTQPGLGLGQDTPQATLSVLATRVIIVSHPKGLQGSGRYKIGCAQAHGRFFSVVIGYYSGL